MAKTVTALAPAALISFWAALEVALRRAGKALPPVVPLELRAGSMASWALLQVLVGRLVVRRAVLVGSEGQAVWMGCLAG